MWLDIVTGTLFILALLQGYRHGFIRAVISFFSLFIGLVVAYQFSGFIAKQLKEHTQIQSHWIPFIAFMIVLILVLLVLKMAAGLLQQTADWLMMGWFNKVLGVFLYAFIYFTIWSSIVYFLQILGVLEPSQMKDTYTYEYLHKWWPYCLQKMGEWLPFIKNTITTFSTQLNVKTSV